MTGPGLPQVPVGGAVLAVGTDLVDVTAFAAQLAQPGTVFAERSFTARERRQAQRRARETGARAAEHLAARWAAKEAFIKAWSQAVTTTAGRPVPPVLAPEHVDWRDIEVVSDLWHRPSLALRGAVAQAVQQSLGSAPAWHLSLTHDGGWAGAVVVCAGPTT